MRSDWQPAALTASLDASLRRLRTDRVDGFLLHSPPAAIAGDPEVGAALMALKAAGKARHVGVSCDDQATLDAALTMEGLTLLQLPWDVIAALPEDAAAAIRARGVLVLAREIIRGQGHRTPAEAVRHAAAHPLVTSTLIGTTSPEHLAELSGKAA
jgi:aryl-alcohol dehydrogenase-like predicted oxidoreductase